VMKVHSNPLRNQKGGREPGPQPTKVSLFLRFWERGLRRREGKEKRVRESRRHLPEKRIDVVFHIEGGGRKGGDQPRFEKKTSHLHEEAVALPSIVRTYPERGRGESACP